MHLYQGHFFVKNIITLFHWRHLNNCTPYENKCFNPRNQNARKFRFRLEVSRDTRCSRALNMQLPLVITEHASNLSSINGEADC